MKIIKWIVLSVLGLIATVFVAMFLYLHWAMKDDPEAAAYAATLTKEQCLTEIAKRYAACDGLNCVSAGRLAGICLGDSKGDRPMFCGKIRDKTFNFSRTGWEQEYCAPANPNSTSCRMVADMTAIYCADSREERHEYLERMRHARSGS
jgi:hypothetical protein